MKNTFFLVLTLLASVCFSQSNKIQWSGVIQEKNDFSGLTYELGNDQLLVVHTKINNLLESSLTESFNFQRLTNSNTEDTKKLRVSLVIYNKDYSVFASNQDVLKGIETADYKGCFVANDKITVFYKTFVNGKLVLSSITLDKSLNKIAEQPAIFEGSTQKSKLFSNSNFVVSYSENKEYCALSYETVDTVMKRKKLSFIVFNQAFQQINKGDFNLDVEAGYSNFLSYHLTNEGKFYLLAAEYFASASTDLSIKVFISSNVERTIKKVYLVDFNVGLPKVYFNEFDQLITSLEITSNNDKVFIVAGYSKDMVGLNGVLSMNFDQKNKLFSSIKMIPFTAEILSTEYRKWQNLNVTENVINEDEDFDLKNYELSFLKIDSKGNLIGGLEKIVMFNNSVNGNSYSTCQFEDVIIFKLNSQLDLEWMSRLKKRQKTNEEDSEDIFASVYPYIEGDNLNLIYSESKANYDKTLNYITSKNGKPKSNSFSVYNSYIVDYVVNIDSGLGKHQVVADFEKEQIMLIPRLTSYSVKNNKLIFYARNYSFSKSKMKLGVYELMK